MDCSRRVRHASATIRRSRTGGSGFGWLAAGASPAAPCPPVAHRRERGWTARGVSVTPPPAVHYPPVADRPTLSWSRWMSRTRSRMAAPPHRRDRRFHSARRNHTTRGGPGPPCPPASPMRASGSRAHNTHSRCTALYLWSAGVSSGLFPSHCTASRGPPHPPKERIAHRRRYVCDFCLGGSASLRQALQRLTLDDDDLPLVDANES